MGRQPFGLASPAAWLRGAGHDVVCVDLTRTRLPEDAVTRRRARRVLPADAHRDAPGARGHRSRPRAESRGPHLRVRALRAAQRRRPARARRRRRSWGRSSRADLRCALRRGGMPPEGGATPSLQAERARPGGSVPHGPLASREFIAPDRSDLPPLTKYASLQVGDDRRIVGYTEATPRVQASLPPLPDRPGLRRPVPRRPDRRRHGGHPRAGGGRARSTSPSAIPISSTARRTRWRSSRRWRASSRASPTTSRSRSSTCGSRPRRCRGCATPAARS